MFEIKFIGNQHTNRSDRGKHVPFVIVNHISSGSMGSMDNWFTSPTNKVSSAHFGISKDGRIHQYVKIEDIAWHCGIKIDSIKNATAKVVKDMNINPNAYCIGIEHEGTDGELTPIQLEASIWLHQYIKNYIKDKYDKDVPFDEYHVIGHCHIDPKRKPNCPGPKFPWTTIYSTLKEYDEEMSIKDDFEKLQKTVQELVEENNQLQNKLNNIEELMKLDTIPTWAKDAVDKAVKSGLIKDPKGGSQDFYRIITVLHRKGLL